MLKTIVNKLSINNIIITMILLLTACNNSKVDFQKLRGNVFGTTFQIQYLDSLNINYSAKITILFDEMNQSLSTYHSNSSISKLNNDLNSLKIDQNFIDVFNLSKQVYNDTDGYFDPSVGKMVNLWGFGPLKPNNDQISKHTIDSLMQYVGFDKLSLINDTIVKQNPHIYLDFNAIAKGFGVDVVGRFLESKGVNNYLIEIGGEIRARGLNSKNKRWAVAIDEPNFDGSRTQKKVISLYNESIATSGNYRKFRIDSITGKKIAHTFNPKTGSPAETDLLSASVIAPLTCAEVDAYATAFMSMGFKKAKALAAIHPEMKVCFIYLENDELQTYKSENLDFIEY